MLNSFQHLIWFFSAFGRHTFHPRPQDGVFRCDLNKLEKSDQGRRLIWVSKVFKKTRLENSHLSTALIRRKWLSKGYTLINANCSKSDLN